MKPRVVEDYLTPPTRRGLRSRGRFDVPSYLYPYMPSILDEAKTSIEQAIRLRKGDDRIAIPVDIVDWAQERFYIPATGKPIELYPHQQGILRLAFTRNEQGHFPYRTIVYSTIKQSGKSTIAGLVQRWYAETQQRHSELYAIGNDKEQAKTRSFREVRRSLELTPGYDTKRERLPGEWELLKETMRCVRTGTEIRALAVDAKGEAGGKPAIQVWCVTGETEVLTRGGWVRADALTIGDECATMDPKTGVMIWAHPRAVNITPYTGKMLRFKHRRVEFVVTPNHRVLGKFIWKSQDTKRENARGWRFEEAQKARTFMGGWLPAGQDTQWEGETYYDPDRAALLGYIVSEGCIRANAVVLAQSKLVHPEIYEKMVAVVDRLGYKRTLYDDSIDIRSRELADEHRAQGLQQDRFIPQELKDAQPEALRAFWDAYMEGDGSKIGGRWGSRPDACAARTVSKRLADDLMEIGLKLGYQPSLRQWPYDRAGVGNHRFDAYSIGFSRAPVYWAKNLGHWTEEEYDGLVACPSLPFGTLYIRYNGKCTWTGNTELWGFENEDALRFWDELTPIPTIPDSLRIVETYAGYLQESTLLLSLYEQGLEGRQLTAGELTERTGVPLDAFAETRGDPDALIPIWENVNAEMLMYWDSGLDARRMPWQLDERGQRYYQQQELTLLPAAFARLHRNEWVSDTSNFIQAEIWDACHDSTIPALEPGDRTPLVVAVDAATTGDCFGIVAVSRHPVHHDQIAIRAVKKYDPRESGGVVDYDEAERFLRFICHGGHVVPGQGGQPALHPKPPYASVAVADPECERCQQGDWDVPGYNVVHIAFDPYQLESMMQRLARDRIAWVEAFSQAGDRLKADRALYDMILTRRIWHRGIEQADLRQHVLNAGAKLQKDQDSTLRLVKVNPNRKIDLAVALSMASARCMYLTL